MIRDAVLHLLNEQPLLVDLFEPPSPADVALLCTNVRTTSGKRPAFVDEIESTFLFPYSQIRFVEVSPRGGRSLRAEHVDQARASDVVLEAAEREASGVGPAREEGPGLKAEDAPELDLDEDFLRRIRDA